MALPAPSPTVPASLRLTFLTAEASVEIADRTRIFERFARADDGRGRIHGGAGLGLALVQRVVAASDGDAHCTDADLGGARFEVRLPAAPV